MAGVLAYHRDDEECAQQLHQVRVLTQCRLCACARDMLLEMFDKYGFKGLLAFNVGGTAKDTTTSFIFPMTLTAMLTWAMPL